MSMKNPARELLDTREGWHMGHRVVAGGNDDIIKPGDETNDCENLVKEEGG